jgi:hypothetical protein
MSGTMQGRHGQFAVHFCEKHRPKHENPSETFVVTNQERKPYGYPPDFGLKIEDIK